ncbi:hypothetical protein Q5P01_021096 [Channa striata]|uniref:Uncharacterized protein n=1 Tax=Channa striata TaxID=64152 RepID=A0AA88LTQ4_CHASR|nr:hypothetical protein Q5P01_021096 [Channa striata]
MSVLVSLQKEHQYGPNLQTRSPLSQQRDLHFPTFHSLLTGGKSGSRWGVGLPAPELHPQAPGKWGRLSPAMLQLYSTT